MQTIKRWVLGLIIVSGAILLGLYFGGVIFKKNPLHLQESKKEIASLMMLEPDQAFKKLKKQWAVTTLIPQDQEERKQKINRLMVLNKKVMCSYKKEMYTLTKLGMNEKSPEIHFLKEKLNQGVLDNALLTRELERFSQGITKAERQKIAELVAVNKECVNCCRQELDAYHSMGVADHDPRLEQIHERMAQAMTEIKQLEPVIGRR